MISPAQLLRGRDLLRHTEAPQHPGVETEAPGRDVHEPGAGAAGRVRAADLRGSRARLRRVTPQMLKQNRNQLHNIVQQEEVFMNTIVVPVDLGAELQITLSFMDGKEMKKTVHERTRVHTLRSELGTDLGIGASRVKLIHGTGVLRANETFAGRNIQDGATVNVVVMPPLYEGSEVYNEVANSFARGLPVRLSDEEVQEHMGRVMENKVALHDALARAGALKQRG
jgi:hypothetical protein